MATDIEKRNAAVYFSWLIDWYRSQHLMPAVGCGLVLGNEVVLTLARGVRRHGHSSPVQLSDRFQLGSITKPITGMLIARLVHTGALSWSRTIGQTWPDLFDGLDLSEAQKAHYGSRTIVDLMTHSSGLDYAPATETDAAYAALHATPSVSQIPKRRLYTRLAVRDEPFHGWSAANGAPQFKYGGGCIVAAGMAQQALNKTWEMLVVTEGFQPLGISSVAIGPMSQLNSVTDIWQHQIQSGSVVSYAIDPGHAGQTQWTHGPAGAVGLSMPDCGKWVVALLNEPTSYMSKARWQEYLSLPAAGYGTTRGGWGGDGNYLSHSGSNTWNYAYVAFDRTRKIGAFAATNICADATNAIVHDLHAELEAAALAWPAMGWLHQAVPPTLVSCSATSTWDNTGNYAAALMSDTWWRTRWASASSTPAINVSLDQPRMLKGVLLCEAYGPRVQTFELDLKASVSATETTLAWSALSPRTQREGLVLRTLFQQPTLAKSFRLRITGAGGAPTLSRLLVLEYAWTTATDFDIDSAGKLWVVLAGGGRVLTTSAALTAGSIVLSQDTAGVASAVRRWSSTTWVIGTDHKVWKSSASGWTQLADASTVSRIAVDASNNVVWSIDANRRIRRHNGSAWVEFAPAGGEGKDLAVHAGTPYVVGMDDFIYRGGPGGWQLLAGSSPKMKRIAVDEASGALWAIALDGRIHSRQPNQSGWTEHPGGGTAKAIAVHGGTPYVLGMNDAIWKSAGAAGWSMLTVLHDKPPPA
ncbi:serine hydrolase domain-containing protein [Sphaerotilaceae bacterium SBD11-9]